MPTWRIGIGDHALKAPEALLEDRSPVFNFYLSGQPHDYTGAIDGKSPAGLIARELVHDVWAWRDGGDPLFRGPLMTCSDTLDGNQHTLGLTGNSYRARLARWPIPLSTAATGMTSLGAAATTPALGWAAINQTLPSSDLASTIVDSHTNSGSNVTQSAQGGTATDAAIDTLAVVSPFDWDLIPTLDGKVHYTTWAQRGTAKPEVVAMYGKSGTGGSNCTVTRTFALSAFANAVWLSGQDANGNSVIAKAANPATPPYGPEGLWVTASSGSTLDSSTLQVQANNALAIADTPAAAYTLAMAAGWWQGPDHVWLGDQIQLVIKSGRLAVNELVRVTQIQITILDGTEQVVLTVGAKPNGKAGQYALARTFQNIDQRFRGLEWRT